MPSRDLAIEIKDISLIYEIYGSPRDQLKQLIFPKFQKFMCWPIKKYFYELKAINNISLQIKTGETVGIIGRNGAGKSTLLQIVCGILSPQNGIVKTNGRVAAILELGAGFNPDFTGRENIYMSARLFGLKKNEVDKRFQSIVRFADIGNFIEQPVKLYSSGMYVRLAFAIIAHADANILIIDEALAVGDAAFTQKCMRFLRVFMEKGTVLFVSHDISSVKNLCSRAIWIDDGKIRFDGVAKDVCDAYMQNSLENLYGDSVKLTSLEIQAPLSEASTFSSSMYSLKYGSVAQLEHNIDRSKGWATGLAKIVSVGLEKVHDGQSDVFSGGDKVRLVINAKSFEQIHSPILGFILKDRLGQELFGENTYSVTAGKECIACVDEELTATFIFNLPMLQNGYYSVMASLASGDPYNHTQHHYLHEALILYVHSSSIRFGIVGIPFEEVAFSIFNKEGSLRNYELDK